MAANCKFIPKSSFRQRRAFYTNSKEGVLTKEAEEEKKMTGMNNVTLMMLDNFNPNKMNSMMGGQVATLLPTILLGTWVSYFFSGFVVARLPFPLTDTFKSMLQSGLTLGGLDASYVSSLSWYLLSIFGLRTISNLFFPPNIVVEDSGMLRAEQPEFVQLNPSNQGKHNQKAIETLQNTHYNFALENAEQELLSKYSLK